MFKTLGILAHVDAGKTTLSEQILYHCGSIRSAGRVDHGDTLLDHDAIERRRGITIYTDQASFRIGENEYYLLDTPGHADFSAEMERSLRVLDYAVLVVSCVEGVQAHTELIWKLLAEYNVPVFFFLNKTDRDGADRIRTMQDIRDKCSDVAVLLDDGIESAAESLAELDETLLDAYLQTGFNQDLWVRQMVLLIRERKLFPCFSGSALSADGVGRFLAGIDMLTSTSYSEDAPVSVAAYKVRHDDAGNRLTYLKILSGVLHAKDVLQQEKVHEIREYSGARYTSVSSVCAGQLCTVTGLHVPAGTIIGSQIHVPPVQSQPLMAACVRFDDAVSVQKVLSVFRILEAEDPQMRVRYVPHIRQIQIAVMGPIQLEVLSEQCAQRFGLSVSFGEPEVLYLETIASPVYGCGHYEPLRHYAEVHILLRPLPRGSGIRFSSACPTDALKLNWQRLIETHVFEKEHIGALCGFPLTDIEVVLLMGRAHEKHTEGGDFRQALYRAVRHAVFHAESVLLEPMYRFQIQAPSGCVGKVLFDLQRMSASYDPPNAAGDDVTVCGRCPASEMMNYHSALSSFTKGRGLLQVQFDGYDGCHNTDAVVEAHPYNREADYENTADSVFCSHGAGYNVHWTLAAQKMHCVVDKEILKLNS